MWSISVFHSKNEIIHICTSGHVLMQRSSCSGFPPLRNLVIVVTVSYSKENMTYWKTKVACTLLMLHNPLFCLWNFIVKCTTCALLWYIILYKTIEFNKLLFIVIWSHKYGIVLSWSRLISGAPLHHAKTGWWSWEWNLKHPPYWKSSSKSLVPR